METIYTATRFAVVFFVVVRRSVALLGLTGLLLGGCRQGSPPAPDATLASSGRTPPSAAPVRTAASRVEEPFFGPPRLPGTRSGDTVKQAGGLLIGLPEGWVVETRSDAHDLASYTLGGLVRASACYQVGQGLLPAGKTPDARRLQEMATALRLVNATWEAPSEVRVGPQGYAARLVRGSGPGVTEAEGTRKAFAIEIDVPTRRTLLFMGAWMDRFPLHEEQMLDMLRGLQPCVVRSGHGCTPIDLVPGR